MQPFRITCETCRSRLKIRTPEVIGEIHACPKCGGMVQIVPPAGWGISPTATATDQPNAAGDLSLSLSTTASIIFPASALNDLSAVTDALEAPAVVATPIEVPAEIVSASALPPAEAGSPVLWWAVGGVASVLLLGGLAWAVWPSGGNKVAQSPAPVVEKHDSQPSTAPNSEQKPAAPAAAPTESKPAPTQAVQAAADQTAKPAEVDPAPAAVKPKEPTPPALVEAKVESAKPVDAPKSAAVAESVKEPIASPPAAAVASAPDHSPVLKFDPLDFDVDRLGSNGKTPADEKTSTSSIPNKLPGDAAGNGAAGNDAPPANAAADQGKQSVATDTTPPLTLKNGVMVRRGLPGDAPQRTASQLLALRVKSLEVTDMPLVQFIETMSGVAGTGITLDPLALEQVGISPQATVSVNAQDAPLQSILHDALAARRLDIAERAGQLRVVLPKSGEVRSIDYDVKDLATGNDASAVGTLIEHFVSPGSWKSAGGAGTMKVDGTTLHIEQSDAVRREVVIFCERLRLARNQTVRSKYPAALLSVESPNQRLSAKLDEKVTFTFLPWTRMSDVMRNWQELSGLTVLADWGALAEAELGPSTPVACSSLDRSWQDALDGVLEPLGLTWWAVNGETIQITTPAALEKIQRVEFYQPPQKLRASFVSGQALIDGLQKELGEAAGKKGKQLLTHMELDEPSGRLIVLASPAVHRQLSHRLSGNAKQ